MRDGWLHPATLRDATTAQREIAAACETQDRIGPIATIAGADTSSRWRDVRGPIHAAIAPIGAPPATASAVPPFPYVPGYLGFRETPALVAAWETLAVKPDLLLVDGHGRAHPRRCGIAVQVGVLLDVPTIGVAKLILCGAVEGELGTQPGATAPLVDRDEIVAMAVRTRRGAQPVYVGIGHRIALATAVDWVLRLSEGRRLPLPIRLAHDAANAARRDYAGWLAAGLARDAGVLLGLDPTDMRTPDECGDHRADAEQQAAKRHDVMDVQHFLRTRRASNDQR